MPTTSTVSEAASRDDGEETCNSTDVEGAGATQATPRPSSTTTRPPLPSQLDVTRHTHSGGAAGKPLAGRRSGGDNLRMYVRKRSARSGTNIQERGHRRELLCQRTVASIE
jgi:hypothetical protein